MGEEMTTTDGKFFDGKELKAVKPDSSRSLFNPPPIIHYFDMDDLIEAVKAAMKELLDQHALDRNYKQLTQEWDLRWGKK